MTQIHGKIASQPLPTVTIDSCSSITCVSQRLLHSPGKCVNCWRCEFLPVFVALLSFSVEGFVVFANRISAANTGVRARRGLLQSVLFLDFRSSIIRQRGENVRTDRTALPDAISPNSHTDTDIFPRWENFLRTPVPADEWIIAENNETRGLFESENQITRVRCKSNRNGSAKANIYNFTQSQRSKSSRLKRFGAHYTICEHENNRFFSRMANRSERSRSPDSQIHWFRAPKCLNPASCSASGKSGEKVWKKNDRSIFFQLAERQRLSQLMSLLNQTDDGHLREIAAQIMRNLAFEDGKSTC